MAKSCRYLPVAAILLVASSCAHAAGIYDQVIGLGTNVTRLSLNNATVVADSIEALAAIWSNGSIAIASRQTWSAGVKIPAVSANASGSILGQGMSSGLPISGGIATWSDLSSPPTIIALSREGSAYSDEGYALGIDDSEVVLFKGFSFLHPSSYVDSEAIYLLTPSPNTIAAIAYCPSSGACISRGTTLNSSGQMLLHVGGDAHLSDPRQMARGKAQAATTARSWV